MKKEIILEVDHGTAKAGSRYIQGLHGVPDYYAFKYDNPEDFYWAAGSKKEDNAFLLASWIIDKNGNKLF